MGFFMVKNEVFELGLSPIEFCVLCYLKRCENSVSKKCNPSRSNIAKSCCMSVQTVDKAIDGLITKGIISKEAVFWNGHQYSNSYTINF